MPENRNSEANVKARAHRRHTAGIAYSEQDPLSGWKSAHALEVLKTDSKPVEPFVAEPAEDPPEHFFHTKDKLKETSFSYFKKKVEVFKNKP